MDGPDQENTLTWHQGDSSTREIVLRVLDGPDQGRKMRVAFGERVVVGSAPTADFALRSPTISREHLQLRPDERGIAIEDLNSKNGTFYGGVRLRNAVVPVGAVLLVGGKTRVRLEYHSQDDRLPAFYGELVGSSGPMRALFGELQRLENLDAPILIEGESGTGKELVARAIHERSSRAAKPFSIIDCSTVQDELFLSSLFGHVQGAFTGATRNVPGVFESTVGGTVFIDEVGELPLALQPRLLRVLETSQVTRIGETTFRDLDFRVLSATHRDLRSMVQAGQFREDLYYRLAGAEVRVPPLRERLEDLPELVEHLATAMGKPGFALASETMEALRGYHWPGNVRELRNCVSRAVHLGTISGGPSFEAEQPEDDSRVDPHEPLIEAKDRVLSAFERNYVATQLARADGNMSEAARLAEVDRSYFRRLCKKYNLS